MLLGTCLMAHMQTSESICGEIKRRLHLGTHVLARVRRAGRQYGCPHVRGAWCLPGECVWCRGSGRRWGVWGRWGGFWIWLLVPHGTLLVQHLSVRREHDWLLTCPWAKACSHRTAAQRLVIDNGCTDGYSAGACVVMLAGPNWGPNRIHWPHPIPRPSLYCSPTDCSPLQLIDQTLLADDCCLFLSLLPWAD